MNIAKKEEKFKTAYGFHDIDENGMKNFTVEEENKK